MWKVRSFWQETKLSSQEFVVYTHGVVGEGLYFETEKVLHFLLLFSNSSSFQIKTHYSDGD